MKFKDCLQRQEWGLGKPHKGVRYPVAGNSRCLCYPGSNETKQNWGQKGSIQGPVSLGQPWWEEPGGINNLSLTLWSPGSPARWNPAGSQSNAFHWYNPLGYLLGAQSKVKTDHEVEGKIENLQHRGYLSSSQLTSLSPNVVTLWEASCGGQFRQNLTVSTMTSELQHALLCLNSQLPALPQDPSPQYLLSKLYLWPSNATFK